MPNRNFSASSYRYGFNGKENDNEIKGDGNSLDFEARIYDSRLGRFLSVDPDISKYPFMSPYCFAANSPLRYVDIDGKGPGDVIVHKYDSKVVNGKTHITVEATINVTIKILNLSSHNVDVEKLGYKIATSAEKNFGGESSYDVKQQLMYDGGMRKKLTDVHVDANIKYNVRYEVINSLDDKSIQKSDNVMVLVDEIKTQGRMNAGGLTNAVGGNFALVEVGEDNNPNKPDLYYNNIAATAVHEFGHQVGLDEAYKFNQTTGVMESNSLGNIMGAGQSYSSTLYNEQRGEIADYALKIEGARCFYKDAGGGYNAEQSKKFLKNEGQTYKGK